MPAIITKNKDVVNTNSIDKLPQTKVKNGYEYILIKRNKKAAIYSQKNIDVPEDTSEGFEVFQIVLSKPYSIMQKNGPSAGMWYHYPLTEKFPGNEDFGKTAWSFTNKDSAEKKYKELS